MEKSSQVQELVAQLSGKKKKVEFSTLVKICSKYRKFLSVFVGLLHVFWMMHCEQWQSSSLFLHLHEKGSPLGS